MDEFDYNRIVYLGNIGLKGVAQESALKTLEQTASQRNAGTFANSAAIVRAMEPVPRMPMFIGTPLLLYNRYQTLL